MIGVVLLILTLVMGLTGYLLPFDQRSYWATIVAMNITGSGPVVGPYLADFLRAGSEFGGDHAAALLRRPHAARPGADHRPDRAPTSTSWSSSGPRRRRGCAPTRSRSRCARRRSGDERRARRRQYLREYEVLKKKGKPFFPYAVFKDSAMFLVVAIVMIAMSLILGAEQGPKADPTTTTYVPRPEWYFFFLFELLRVIKPPELVPIATVGIPTLCMVLLLLLPFYDRNPERRPVAPAGGDHGGDHDDHRDGLPDLPRRLRRLADRDRPRGPAAVRGRQAGRRAVGLPRAATSSARTATTARAPS